MAAPSSKSDVRPHAHISVGIGSWTDAEYTGVIFPKGVKSEERLKIYATHFDHVELNSSYHALPRIAWVENWVKQTPPGFIFDFKLLRAFSETPEATTRGGTLITRVLETARPLIDAGKFGFFFLVMPPSFGPKRGRLEELEALATMLQPHTLAVELRHNGWVEGEQRARTLEFFRAHKLVWIAVDMPQIADSTLMPPIDEVTNPRFAYLRLHGRRADWLKLKSAGGRHAYEYSADELEEIAARVRALAEKAERVHVVANNHAQDFAPKAALALQRLLGIERKGPPTEAEAETKGGLRPGF